MEGDEGAEHTRVPKGKFSFYVMVIMILIIIHVATHNAVKTHLL